MMQALGHIGFGLFGLAMLVGIAFMFSNNKRAVDWRLVGTGVLLQIVSFLVLDRLTPGSLRDLVVSPRLHPGSFVAGAAQLSVSAIVCASIA